MVRPSPDSLDVRLRVFVLFADVMELQSACRWNSTTTVDLNLQLAEADTLVPFFGPIPGPLFQVTYPADQLVTTTVGGSTVAAAAADTGQSIILSAFQRHHREYVLTYRPSADLPGSPDPIATVVTKEASGGLPAGSIFAAVVFPLAIIVGGVILYILYTRRKQSKKRQRYRPLIYLARASFRL
jgi:hypothetical protein